MPLRFHEEYMNSDWRLRLFWGERNAIQIINKSKTTIRVALGNPVEVTGLKPGASALYAIDSDSVRVTISYYTKDRENRDLFANNLLNNGRHIRVVESGDDRKA